MKDKVGSFTLDSDELTNWIRKDIKPKGYEDFKYIETDTSTGDFDSEKGAMTDYEIKLFHKDGRIWIAKDGYYTGPTGHVFNYAVTFHQLMPDIKPIKIYEGYLNYKVSKENIKTFITKDGKEYTEPDLYRFRVSDINRSKGVLDRNLPIAKVTIEIGNRDDL